MGLAAKKKPARTGGWHENAVRVAGGLPSIKKINSPKKNSVRMKAHRKKKPSPTTPKPNNNGKKKLVKKKGLAKGDPIEIILAKMAELDKIGITSVTEELLLKATGYARSDSTGYRKATKKLIKELQYLSKATVNKSTSYSLTEKGRSHLLEKGTIVVPEEPKTNQEQHQQFLETLQSMVKAPVAKLEAIFGKLLDGKWHAAGDLLALAGYNRPDSTGYRNIMSGMNKLGLLETTFQKSGASAASGSNKTKKIRFGDKAFPFGRPSD